MDLKERIYLYWDEKILAKKIKIISELSLFQISFLFTVQYPLSQILTKVVGKIIKKNHVKFSAREV